MVFHVKENIILHQLFESKEDHISHLQKVKNKELSLNMNFFFGEKFVFL